jgi:hypothetical protein
MPPGVYLIGGQAQPGPDRGALARQDRAALLGRLLPTFLDLMMDHPAQPWPMPHYPVVAA